MREKDDQCGEKEGTMSTEPQKEEPSEGLNSETLAHLKAVQRRRLVLAGIAGVVLLILGFFAGQTAREQRNSESSAAGVVMCVTGSYSAPLGEGAA